MDELQADIGQWAAATFKDRPTVGIVTHLRREVKELTEALVSGQPVESEVADVIILALNLADRMGFSACQAVRAKMAKNKARRWGPPDAEGICEHVRGD